MKYLIALYALYALNTASAAPLAQVSIRGGFIVKGYGVYNEQLRPLRLTP